MPDSVLSRVAVPEHTVRRHNQRIWFSSCLLWVLRPASHASVFKSELRLGKNKACALKSIMVFLGIRQFRIVHNY